MDLLITIILTEFNRFVNEGRRISFYSAKPVSPQRDSSGTIRANVEMHKPQTASKLDCLVAVVGYREDPKLFSRALESYKTARGHAFTVVGIDGDDEEDQDMVDVFDKVYPSESHKIYIEEPLGEVAQRVYAKYAEMDIDQSKLNDVVIRHCMKLARAILDQQNFSIGGADGIRHLCLIQRHMHKKGIMFTTFVFSLVVADILGIEFMWSSDSDTMVLEATLEGTISTIAGDPTVGGASSGLTVHNGDDTVVTRLAETVYWAELYLTRSTPGCTATSDCQSGPCTAFRLSALSSILIPWYMQRVFGKRMIVNEDRHLTTNLLVRGWGVVFASDVLTYTETPNTMTRWLSQQVRWARATHIESLLIPRVYAMTHPMAFYAAARREVGPLVATITVLLYLFTSRKLLYLSYSDLFLRLGLAAAYNLARNPHRLRVASLFWVVPGMFFYNVPLPAIHLWSLLTMTADTWGTAMRATSELSKKESSRKRWFETGFFVIWMGIVGGTVARWAATEFHLSEGLKLAFMTTITMSFQVVDVRFEHYRNPNTLGVHEHKPRISWRLSNASPDFEQQYYELRLEKVIGGENHPICTAQVESSESHLVPWPAEESLISRQRYTVSVRVRGKRDASFSDWSEPAWLETGLLNRSDWTGKFISAPWSEKDNDKPKPEDLFRKAFSLKTRIASARLYITAQGVYEAEINGHRVGDYFLAPGWSCYDNELTYQTYDVTSLLSSQDNCLGVRLAEGWFTGRLSFDGGIRNRYGTRTSLLAQLELQFSDGSSQVISSDDDWMVAQGPIRLAEIYNGEKYDATLELPGWSSHEQVAGHWERAIALPFISEKVNLTAGYREPVRRIETLKPVSKIITPSGKTILDFGQNLVGYVRIKGVQGQRGHEVTLKHAEVLENGELGIRPLRVCDATDVYTMRGDAKPETYEPRFTYHGFRYVQIDNWPCQDRDVIAALEAVVCHTDMEEQGTFACSNEKVNQLFSNVRWSMRDNFLSIPTDCPQRDERLGWTGDLALFAPTATYIYGCYPILRDWLKGVWFDQQRQGGVPPMVSPNILDKCRIWGPVWPCAIWHDVVVLAPWALYQETADPAILVDQFESMETWFKVIPKNKDRCRHLWDFNADQLADWLDPSAPPNDAAKATTDPPLVANAFLINSLDVMVRVCDVLGKKGLHSYYKSWADNARAEFTEEYVSPSGRLVSDTQTAYSLAICFNLLNKDQLSRAGSRLAEVVRRNGFRIGTGFAGTPFVCEALTLTGHSNVAYAMLLNEKCPSWLYAISMGATTTWERWDSMLPDGSINPGEMTSFNHYAYGAIAKFMVERLAGLERVEAGWKRMRVQPVVEGDFTWASASHLTPYGRVSSSWRLEDDKQAKNVLYVEVEVPPSTTMEVVLPSESGTQKTEVVGSGEWSFTADYQKQGEWPVEEIKFILAKIKEQENIP
ncbi:alfa-L-rhamnosidase [Fusarium beomiforme]|uniref:alpha-L-rhamnosidase n=1 Tax=Fusarium beomiforme TaxID=44412 RepID=A0A9P5E336_9HYPO|nr:alfa-L-rhamnosidase [Fusarium beomiforme]